MPENTIKIKEIPTISTTGKTPDLFDDLFAQALACLSSGQSIPQAESFPAGDNDHSVRVCDAEVLAARNSASAMILLWDRLQPLIQYKVSRILRDHRHTSKDDLEQEAWIVFAQAVERYDGRSRDAFRTYLGLCLHTRFRQFAAHDRVIPIPHDTRQKRAPWHKITPATFDARLQAQDLSYPDAENEGWSHITHSGENSMETQVIEKMDEKIMSYKLQRLPRRWRDLLLMSQKYSDTDLAMLLSEDEKHMIALRNRIMEMLRSLPTEYFAFGKSEADYLCEWDALLEKQEA